MKAQKFSAVLEKGENGLGWTVVRVPFEPRKAWPEMIRQRVQGTVNGVPFRTSLFPYLNGGFYLLVNKAAQKDSGARLGQKAEFTLLPDMEERPAGLPEELDALLDEVEGLRAWYSELSESMRREIGKWICGVKSEESRRNRAEQTAEQMLAAMEGEVELPPVIAAAFRMRPRAKLGWAKMTQHQRRGELMAVFHYKSPESRQKRVEKLCALAESKA